MATYIKIRELNPYPESTGVFSGDMLALALDTTTAGTPHLSQATQRATVEQVINSYNTTIANQSTAARAAGNTTVNNIVVDSAGNLTQDQTLTAATFGDFIQIGGGLEWDNPCLVNNAFVPGCNSKPTLSLASSTESVNFNLVVSGGAIPPSEYRITPGVGNSWVSGRFPTFKSALNWMNANITSAEIIRILVTADPVENDVLGDSHNIGGKNIEKVMITDYGLYSMMSEANTHKPANTPVDAPAYWTEGYPGYAKYDVVKYTGKNDGTVGDYNYYRCISNNMNAPLGGAGWERLTPSGSDVLGAIRASNLTGSNGDPNGFNSIGFTSRPTITFNQHTTESNTNSIPMWISQDGETWLNGLKLKYNNVNVNNERWDSLIRRGGQGALTIANTEIHVEGAYIPKIFEGLTATHIRVTNSFGEALNGTPDPYNVTGSKGINTTMASLYLSISGLLGGLDTDGNPAGTGIGCIVHGIGSKTSLGTEYWNFATRNGTFEHGRLQLGSGQNYMTSAVDIIESSSVEGNMSVTQSPTTSISPGGVNVSITGYNSATNQGLGHYGAAYLTYPGVAPIAARQFASNNIADKFMSGDGSWQDVKYPSNNAVCEFMSGDAFMSSKYPGYPQPATTALPVYERYPD